MNYIIFDLEFNQVCPPTSEDIIIASKECPFEIIQIGAVKLNNQLEVIDGFNRLVKPAIYLEMNPFVSKLTRITTEQLSDEASFKDVFADFKSFIGDDEVVLCVWGMSDMKELFRNLKYHQINIQRVPKRYINLQPYLSEYFDLPKGLGISLRNGIDFLDIPYEVPMHNAYHDAFYTAKIFQAIYSTSIKYEIYYPEEKKEKKRPLLGKKHTDTTRLIGQFEKMYSREMTNEEQDMIKLAYVMGKTQQFEVVKKTNR